MNNKYAFQGFDVTKMARAQGKFLPISTKESTEICKMIKRKDLQAAKIRLQKVITMEMPVKFNRHKHGLSHMKKMGSARFPIRACSEILKIVESLENNAQVKNMDVSKLTIIHACAHKAGSQFHYGRQSRRLMKRTHLELVAEQTKPKKDVSAKDKSKEHKDVTTEKKGK